jgi:hypothetical protein
LTAPRAVMADARRQVRRRQRNLKEISMDTTIASEVKVRAIAANLEALHGLLLDAAKRSAQGYDLIQLDEANGAIGAVLGLDAVLDDAKALYGAALALHRLRAV